MATQNKFDPLDLDIYTGRGGGFDVVQYLAKSGKYTLKAESPTYDFAAGIGKVYTMRHHRTLKKINVIESLTKNPLDAIAHFHSTCVFGAWTASGFWHAYARLTFTGLTLTSPSRLPLRDDIEQHRRIWRIVRKYHDRGFSFTSEHAPPHTCGVDFDCPCTMRSSDDDGCLFAVFPSWEFNNDVVQMRPISWSLGGVGCTAGILARAESASAPAGT
ncbi:hypothetical protein DFH06DRAFT_993666 [Mycena polygramma]|nr:hypothetical protein DFH06DRAFT_993666 [Mycena polygramma]